MAKSVHRHSFGGDWTSEKLDILTRYLRAYTTVLKDKPSSEHPFIKHYIDAFAGSGYRTPSASHLEDVGQGLLDGSARIALQIDPPFDRFVFIEAHRGRSSSLEELRTHFPHHDPAITVLQGDANTELQAWCQRPWRSERAVLFLDPYGLQVDWATIEAVATTKAIDMWLLFPVGIGVNRMLTNSGEIPEAWRRRLDTLLGTEAWFDEFYSTVKGEDLFGPTEHVVKAGIDTIGRYFNGRLRSIFPAVADKPRLLKNSRGMPLYMLCFAAANERGAPIALRIANHILNHVE